MVANNTHPPTHQQQQRRFIEPSLGEFSCCRYIFNCCLFVSWFSSLPLSPHAHNHPLDRNLYAVSCRCDNVLRVLGAVPCPATVVPVRPGVGTLQNSQRVAFHVWRDPLLRIMVSEGG